MGHGVTGTKEALDVALGSAAAVVAHEPVKDDGRHAHERVRIVLEEARLAEAIR